MGRDFAGSDLTGVAIAFQSTRPRGARRPSRRVPPLPRSVSIHAPAWGATRCESRTDPSSAGFNPRARVGRDGIDADNLDGHLVVSIHAPAWGATGAHQAAVLRPREFQSTRPRGARRWGSTRAGSPSPCFNPRARVGRDQRLPLDFRAPACVSIHAPAWGATGQSVTFAALASGFNPRARVGRDDTDRGRPGRL